MFKIKSNIAVFILLISLVVTLFPNLIGKVNAASLTTVAVALGNSSTSQATSVAISFTPVTAITTGSIIEVAYDSAFTGGATVTDGNVATAGTNITSSSESAFAAGYFKSTLTTSGSVTTAVTITVSTGLTTPSSIGNYGFTVSVDIGGTHSTYDSGAGLSYIGGENSLQVTAIVPATLDMELYVQNSDTLLTNTPNGCALSVLSLSAVKSCTYDIGYGTNNSSGVTVKVQADGKLRSGANDINDVSDSTVTAGSEEYGFRITDAGTGCSATASGSYGSQDSAVPTSVTTFFTNSTSCNGTTSGQSAKRVEITHKASMDTNTVVAADYAQIVTYTAFSN